MIQIVCASFILGWPSINSVISATNSQFLIAEDSDFLKRDFESKTLKITNNHFQNGVIKGKVVNETGAPMSGVTVTIKELNQSVMTNENGEYSISAKPGEYTITLEFISHNTEQRSNVVLTSGSELNLDFTMTESSENLEEVVVVGYGKQKKSDLTTSVSQLANPENAARRPVSGIGQMLQGQIAGVSAVAGSGNPGQEPRVVIRGAGSFGSESPLYVVDGMPYYGGRINPNDIKSVTVLKDAAAAAIYGAQAASGVIVIETKSGTLGTPKVGIEFYQGWQSAYKLPQALNAEEYNAVYNKASEVGGTEKNPARNAAINPWGAVTRTNWVDEVFRTGPITNLNLQISGGSERSRYMSSFGYHKNNGIMLNTDYERFSFRVKSDYDITDKLQFGQNIYISRFQSRGAAGDSYSGILANAIYMNPAAPVYGENGQFHGTVPHNLSQFGGAYGDTYNPVALLLRPNINNPGLNVNGIGYGQYTFFPGFSFKSSFSIDMWSEGGKNFRKRVPEIGRPDSQNYLTQSQTNRLRWIWDQQLNYDRTFGLHKLGVTAVYTAQYRREEGFGIQMRNFDVENDWFQYLANGQITQPPTSFALEDALTSAIGRLTYDYDDRYFFMGSVRRDVTSKLAPKNKADIFPAISGAWKISSESFFNVESINLLKLRASWGQIGNISSVGFYAFDTPLSSGNDVIIGDPGSRNRRVAVNQLSNPNLVWERSETMNIGLDFAMLNNTLKFTAEYYNKYTKNLIAQPTPDPHTGVSSGSDTNIGEALNKGIEFSLGYNNTTESGFQYNINANFSKNHNEILNLDGFNSPFVQHSNSLRQIISPFRSEPGQPIFSYHLIPTDGIFQSQEQIDAYVGYQGKIQPNARPGDLIFRDVNGDGLISESDRVYMGNAMPDFNYGLNINFGYKNFDFTAFGQGVGGVKLFNGSKYTTYNAGLQGYNLDRRVLDAWQPGRTDAEIPILSTNDPNNNFGTVSDWYLESGDYFRIKNLTLGYTIPEHVFGTFRPGTLLRFYASVENLATFTKYSGVDPEVGSGAVIDNGTIPVPRTFTVGLNFNF